MKGERAAGVAFDRSAAADLWRNTISQIPSVFGKLVYLASLRNPNNGAYEHHGLALVFGEDEANKALRNSHNKVFAEWLSFNLEQQKADLDLYISGLVRRQTAGGGNLDPAGAVPEFTRQLRSEGWSGVSISLTLRPC